METKEIKLPDTEKAEFLSNVFLKKEWVIDPAFLKRLPDDIVIDIFLAGVNYNQGVASLQAKMWGQVAEALKRQR